MISAVSHTTMTRRAGGREGGERVVTLVEGEGLNADFVVIP